MDCLCFHVVVDDGERYGRFFAVAAARDSPRPHLDSLFSQEHLHWMRLFYDNELDRDEKYPEEQTDTQIGSLVGYTHSLSECSNEEEEKGHFERREEAIFETRHGNLDTKEVECIICV